MRSSARGLRRTFPITLLIGALALLAGPVAAQPFGAWLALSGADGTYISVPHSSSLNPTDGFTFEAWVAVTASSGCDSIAGKNWQQSWWVGICGTTLRSYLRGSTSIRNGGTVPAGKWTHIAVTWDGAHRRHYINGELISSFAETEAPTTSTSALRIAGDVSWQFAPSGAIDEVRLWNVARTTQQLRDAINEPILADTTGLVATWGFDANADDVTGDHDGSGVGGPGYLTFPVAPFCVPNATTLCLDERFAVTAEWRNYSDVSGVGSVASCGTDDSGLFWFFHPQNWEVLIKSVNGCGLNNRYWIYSAATTDVFYRIQVTDVVGGASKTYFNYLGEPAVANNDSDAFATCP
jgi:hypothetical protein